MSRNPSSFCRTLENGTEAREATSEGWGAGHYYTVRPASGLDFVMLVSDECSVRAQQTMSRVIPRVSSVLSSFKASGHRAYKLNHVRIVR